VDTSSVKAIEWKDNELVLLDQRILPHKEEYVSCTCVEDVFVAIRAMIVRGAPAIGICAAYGVVLSAQSRSVFSDEAVSAIERDIEHLRTARPTAVNLMWALDVMLEELSEERRGDLSVEILLDKAKQIHSDDIFNNLLMGELACAVIGKLEQGPSSVLTHCNAGALATGGYGTALGVVRAMWESGLLERVFADETRPWLQGARLTVWELEKDGIPVVLNVDCAASWVMKNKQVKWLIVGADRIAANGDVVNKIGTYGLAIQAKYHGVKVMVVAPSSTVDMQSRHGEEIEIEMRDLREVRALSGQLISLADVDAVNPVFDITPASLVDFIVTEKGVIHNPDALKMNELFGV
jgi:methylthioribose-1-phosphate isomerase